MSISLQPWHTDLPTHALGGSLYSAPRALRNGAARLLANAGHRIHLDVIIGAAGHQGLTWEDVRTVARQSHGHPLDLHLILLDGIAPRDEEQVLFDTAREIEATAITINRGTLQRHPGTVAALRADGMAVWLELQPGDADPDEHESSVLDGATVMLITSGTKQQADPARLDVVERLARRMWVSVDGGVSADLAHRCVEAGAGYVVSGRALFAVDQPSPSGRSAAAVQSVADEIALCLASVDPDALDRAVEFIERADGQWFFTGQGRSGLVAQMAGMRFTHLGRQAHVVGEATAPSIGPGDHLVAISSSGTTTITRHLAQVAHDHGADLLLITASPDSPLAEHATATLVVPRPTTQQFAGSLFEQSALLLLDALVLALTGADAHTYEAMAARHTNLQ